jgi:hypothetical protein
VPHDACKLRLIVAGLEQAAVDRHGPAGEGKGIHAGHVQHGEAEFKTALCLARVVAARRLATRRA